MNSPEDTNAGPVIRDLRRIDPVTGQVRDPGQSGRRDPDPRTPGKARPGRHAASKPGGTGARPAATPGNAPGGPPPEGAGQPGADRGPGPAGPGRPGPGAASQGAAGQGAAGQGAAGQGADGQGAGDADSPGSAGQGPAGQGSAGQGSAGQGGSGAAGPPSGGAGPQATGAPAGQAAGLGGDAALAQLAERTADLQRVHAEYANYRKRVERDRMAVREQALANVLSALLPVLDDIGRAREAGELTGGFKSVGESLETTAAKLGLESFGDAGEPFDPRIHEALMHSYSSDVTEATAVQILQPGYKVGERIVRPARVAVAEPSDGPDPGSQEETPPDTGSMPGPGQQRGTPAGNN